MAALPAAPLLEVDGLKTHFFTRDGVVRAVDGVSFSIQPGETLSLVGESGCGKSTVARLICGPYGPTRGRVVFDGVDLASTAPRSEILTRRRLFQMISQAPYGSLNPRWRVERIVAE